MEASEKLKRCRIQIQSDNPFFAYLSLYLKFREARPGELPPWAGMGVDARGNCTYSKEFVEKITDNELKGVVVHEILHLCLTGESPVLTEDGFKPIKDIKVGDRVYSNRGLFTEVTGISERDYKGNIYTIKSRFGLPCSFTPNHPILTKKIEDYRDGWGFGKSFENSLSGSKGNGVRFINAEKLNKNDSLVFPIPNPNEVATRIKKICSLRNSIKKEKVWLDKDTAYFIGYFVGDGSLHRVKKTGKWLKNSGKSERNICITFHEKEDTTRLESIIRTKFFRSPCLLKVKGKRAKRVVFSCYGVAKYLRKHFYKNNKKSIPTWLIYEKNEIIKSFLDGLFDSDGHERGNLKSITSVYPTIYSFIPLLLLRIGNPSFKMSLHNNVCSVGWLKERKHNYTKIIGNKMFHPVSSTNKKYFDGKVYNLETKAHTFCCPYFVTHNCFLHLMRLGNKMPEKWNIATDIVVNYILKQNSFQLPQGCLETNYDNSIEIFGQKIDDVNKKTPEQIYDELKFKTLKIRGRILSKGSKIDGNDGDGGFDVHDYDCSSDDGNGKGKDKKDKKGKGKEGCGLTEEEKRELEREWKERLSEAYVTAHQIGRVPAEIDRLMGNVHKNELNWRNILLRQVQNVIPYDYTYAIPHKKSCSSGYYMPNTTKEMINVIVGVDVSGSIGQKEYADFLSEIIGMAQAFRDRITIRFLTHDVTVHNDYIVENGNVEKIKALKITGGGGTSHKPIMDYIDENIRNVRLAIFLTDGYSDLESIDLNQYNFKKIFVIQKNGNENCIKDTVRNLVIKLKGDYDD